MTEAAGVTEVTDAVGVTEGRRRTGAISSSSSSEIVIGVWETGVFSSSEIRVGEWVLAEMTEARGAAAGTDAGKITEATDAKGARGAGATDANALRRSSSMKCVLEVRTKGKSNICLRQLYYNSEENITSL